MGSVARVLGYPHRECNAACGRGIGNMQITACGPGFLVDGATKRCLRGSYRLGPFIFEGRDVCVFV